MGMREWERRRGGREREGIKATCTCKNRGTKRGKVTAEEKERERKVRRRG